MTTPATGGGSVEGRGQAQTAGRPAKPLMWSEMNDRPIPQRKGPMEVPRLENIRPHDNERQANALAREEKGHIADVLREEAEAARRAKEAAETAQNASNEARDALDRLQNPLKNSNIFVGGQGENGQQMDDATVKRLVEALKGLAPEAGPRLNAATEAARKSAAEAQVAIDRRDDLDSQVDREIGRADELEKEIDGVIPWLDSREGNPDYVLTVNGRVTENERRIDAIAAVLTPEHQAISGATAEAKVQSELRNNRADEARDHYTALANELVAKYTSHENPDPELALLMASADERLRLEEVKLEAEMAAKHAERFRELMGQAALGLNPEQLSKLVAEKLRLEDVNEGLKAKRPALLKETIEDQTGDLTPIQKVRVEAVREFQRLETLILEGGAGGQVDRNRGGGEPVRVNREPGQSRVWEYATSDDRRAGVEAARILPDPEKIALWAQVITEAQRGSPMDRVPARQFLVDVFGQEVVDRRWPLTRPARPAVQQ